MQPTAIWRERFAEMGRPEIDWLTVAFVALMATISVAAVALASLFSAPSAPAPTPQQRGDLSLAPALMLWVVVESLVLVALWRLWARIPDWLGPWLLRGVAASVLVYLGHLAAQAGALGGYVLLLALWVGLTLLFKLLSRWDMYWTAHNLAAVGLAIIAAVFGGLLLSPTVVAAILVLALWWDVLAVDLSELMGDLVSFSAGAGIPNYVVIPSAWRVDMDRLKSFLVDGDDKPASVRSVIGVGDFAFPAALVVSAWVAGPASLAVGALLGSLLGFILLRAAMTDSGGMPALPWAAGGALSGYAIAAVALAATAVVGGGI